MLSCLLPAAVPAAYHCSAVSNRCPRANDNCSCPPSDCATHRRATGADGLDAGTRNPCWPPGRWTRICERCWAPGTVTAAPSSAAATCHSDPLDHQSHRFHLHLPICLPHEDYVHPTAPVASVWAWLWAMPYRLCRAWRTKELQGRERERKTFITAISARSLCPSWSSLDAL